MNVQGNIRHMNPGGGERERESEQRQSRRASVREFHQGSGYFIEHAGGA